MAEGFANFYGKDVLQASSAGLAPTALVAAETVASMLEKNVDVSSHFPKKFEPLEAKNFDLIVNMSGFNLPGNPDVPKREWKVEDPYGQNEAVYGRSRDDIENRVMHLILELRRELARRLPNSAA